MVDYTDKSYMHKLDSVLRRWDLWTSLVNPERPEETCCHSDFIENHKFLLVWKTRKEKDNNNCHV